VNHEELDRVMSPADLRHTREWSEQPSAKEPRTRGGLGQVDEREQGPSLRTFDGANELQVGLSGLVEKETFTGRVSDESSDG
jgi:hypothetical protein